MGMVRLLHLSCQFPRIMKRDSMVAIGIFSASVLAAQMTCQAQIRSQVYSVGIFSSGTTYYDVCSTSLPFPPFKYNFTELSWFETSNGDYICGIPKNVSGCVSRRCLEVASGTDDFFLPLDSGPARTPFVSEGDPPRAPTIVPIVKGSGDFARILTQCAMNRGSRTPTNALPALQAGWSYGIRTNEDIFIFQGDPYARIQDLLEHAFGKPDASIRSTESAGGDTCSIYYSPGQIGVFLSLARTWDDVTIVSIVGGQSKAKARVFR